jgi:MbtH protein
MSRDEDDSRVYKVVINHEEQYSIWPADRVNALGWQDAGKTGTKAECLAHIDAVWTDMRPLSLRKHMEKAALEKADRERAGTVRN